MTRFDIWLKDCQSFERFSVLSPARKGNKQSVSSMLVVWRFWLLPIRYKTKLCIMIHLAYYEQYKKYKYVTVNSQRLLILICILLVNRLWNCRKSFRTETCCTRSSTSHLQPASHLIHSATLEPFHYSRDALNDSQNSAVWSRPCVSQKNYLDLYSSVLV